MLNSSKDPTQGTYLCRGCQTFFLSDMQSAVVCPQCKLKQVNAEAWDQIIKQRDTVGVFNNAIPVDYGTLGTRKNDAKLNIIENKKAKRKLMMFLIALVWVGGIGLLMYKASEKEKLKIENLAKQPSAEKLQQTRKQTQQRIFSQAVPKIEQFLLLDKRSSRSHLVYQTDEDILYTAFNNSLIQFPKDITSVQAIQNQGAFAEVSLARKQGSAVELVLVEQDGSWLIDWDHFSNASSISFTDFLTNKPTEAHTFRLYFTVDAVAGTQEITFIEAQRNNDLFNLDQAKRLRVKFPSDHPLHPDIDALVNHCQDCKSYNSSLEAHQRSILGTSDPTGYYRINVTLKWVKEEDRMLPEVVSINAGHWLGSYWKDTFTPTQKLTLRGL